jgi:hypothetical protein
VVQRLPRMGDKKITVSVCQKYEEVSIMCTLECECGPWPFLQAIFYRASHCRDERTRQQYQETNAYNLTHRWINAAIVPGHRKQDTRSRLCHSADDYLPRHPGSQ